VASDIEKRSVERGYWHRPLALTALALNGFAIVTVNYWIYTARWEYIDRNGSFYKRPPTISRAISDPVIGEPFAFWMTISAICLGVGVALLTLIYLWIAGRLRPKFGYLWVALWVLGPAAAILQGVASLGIYWLSSYRFPSAHEMHMIGSYSFFVSQALVVLLYTLLNHALLRHKECLQRLDDAALIAPHWVRARFIFGLVSLSLVVVYFVLFTLKDVYAYDDARGLYLFYVSVEPAVITSFLLVLAMAHADLFLRPRD